MEREAAVIAHNVREHVEMLLDLEQAGVAGEVKQRLHQHIAEEERGNAARMNAILASLPPPPPREILLVRDHSLMLVDVLSGALPAAIGLKLLHHLLEEHTEIIALGRQRAPAPRLTLGSLRGRPR